jgi:hypothetical protein
MVRATSSGHGGGPALENQNSLLTLINRLLNKGLSTGVKKKK